MGNSIVDGMSPQADVIGLTDEQYSEMYRQVEAGYQAQQAAFNADLQRESRMQLSHLSIQRTLGRSLDNNPNIFANLQAPVVSSQAALSPAAPIEEVVVQGKRLPPALTMDDLWAIREGIANRPRQSLSPGVRVFDRDAIHFVGGAYAGSVRESRWQARETFRKGIEAAEAINPGEAKLIITFPEGASAEAKLADAIRAGGGYFTDEVGENLWPRSMPARMLLI